MIPSDSKVLKSKRGKDLTIIFSQSFSNVRNQNMFSLKIMFSANKNL